MEFSLNVAVGVMKGAGYAFADFKDALVGGTLEWTLDQLADVLVLPSGFGLADVAGFLLDVAGLTLESLVQRAHGLGIPVEDVIAAVKGSVATSIDSLVDKVTTIYGLTVDQLIPAMKSAGYEVAEFADAVLSRFEGLTINAAAAALKLAGYTAHAVGDWVVSKLSAFPDKLERAALILAEAGYVFEDVAAWAWDASGRLVDKTAGILEFANYTANQAARFLVGTAGNAARTVFDAFEAAGYSAAEAATAMILESYAEQVETAQWLKDTYESDIAEVFDILLDLGADLQTLIKVALETYQATLDQVLALLNGIFTTAEILAAWTG